MKQEELQKYADKLAQEYFPSSNEELINNFNKLYYGEI